jgi:hypothetical protein
MSPRRRKVKEQKIMSPASESTEKVQEQTVPVPAETPATITFWSPYKKLQVWMRPASTRLINGIMMADDPGHMIQFQNGLFVADNLHKVQCLPGKPTLTEVEFLREMEKARKDRGDDYQVYEHRPEEQKKTEGEYGLFAALSRRRTPELLSMFTAQERVDFGLDAMGKELLIIKVFECGKQVPAAWLKEAAEAGIPRAE